MTASELRSGNKQKVYILAHTVEEYERGVSRCIDEQDDFLEVYHPVWCNGELGIKEVYKGNAMLIDCREQSVLLENYNINYNVV